MTSGGIFGPKLSGKTTLARALSKEYWRASQMRTLVLDLNNEDWGEQAFVSTNEAEFWSMVWKAQGMLIVVEESAETINRDKKLIAVFTRLRHLKHKLLVIGHSGVNLLPIMREQLDTLYLFRQSERASKVWAETFCQKDLMQAQELQQFEFFYTSLYSSPKKTKLKI